MPIYIPDKIIYATPVNIPGNANDGKIYFKYKNGILPLSPTGAPNWIDTEFSGTPQSAVTSFMSMPAPTRNVYYVSNSEGNDANNGTSPSTPLKTITRAMTVMAAGDHVYLKRGDVWIDQILHPVAVGNPAYAKSGVSSSERSLISFYGSTGPRPKLSCNNTVINTFDRGGLRHFILDGIHIHSRNRDPLDPAFTSSKNLELIAHAQSKGITIPEHLQGGAGSSAGMNFRGGNTHDVIIHDCVLDYLEITVEDVSKNNAFPGYPSNIQFINNIFTGAYNITTYAYKNARPSSLFCSPCLGLTIRGNVFDYGGWNPNIPGASANMYNHNIYLAASNNAAVTNSYLVENNIICRGSSHGMHCRPGGTVLNNFFSRNSINVQVGYGSGASTAMGEGALPLVENNVSSESWSMWKGWNNDALFESFYVVPNVPADQEDPLRSGAKWGINFENYGSALITARNNISQIGSIAEDAFMRVGANTVGFQTKAGPLYSNVNNIVWQFPNQTGSYSSPGRTLGHYDAYLNGTGSFDSFMQKVKSRPLRGYDSRYTATAINNYVRAGYDQ